MKPYNAQVKIANYDNNLQQALKKGSVTIPKTEFSYTQGVVSNPTITDNLLNVGQRIDFPTVYSNNSKLAQEKIRSSQAYKAVTENDLVRNAINDHDWNANVFLPTVGKRGAAIIAARGLSLAASAANAAIDHMRDWALGSNGQWVTMGVPSNGEYGIPKDVIFGFPVTTEGGKYKIVEGLEIDAFSRERMDKTLKELEEERAAIAHLLG